MRFKDIFSDYKYTSEFKADFEKSFANNPELWNKLQKQFDVGRQIISVQLKNGLEKLNEEILRLYLHDYARRFLKYGPETFPSSFNALEPFFIYNHHNSVIQLIEQEESYGVSLFDFLDFVTKPTFNLGEINFYENLPERTIYHFTFSGFEEINFSNSQGKTFVIGGLSLVRQGNEVSMLIQAGESYDKKEAEEYFKKHTRKHIEESISARKKALGFEIDYEGEPKVIHFNDRDDLWLHAVALLFDLESKKIDIRHVARDENINYKIITDDFSAIVFKENSFTSVESHEFITSILNQLNRYDAVFDFAKYCLALPFYVFENEERLIDVVYETSLKSLLSGPVAKKQYALVPNSYKIYAKPFYYLESKNQTVIENKELNDDSFTLEQSGYWKRIGANENGFDKKGRIVIGKTWVERNDIYYTNPKGITKAEEVEVFNGENAGYIYVMRQPSNEENIFKIGLTQRSISERKKELSNTSSIDKFFVINGYHTKDCFEAEKLIHKKLDGYRLTKRREFFRCDLKIILKACEEVVNEVNK